MSLQSQSSNYISIIMIFKIIFVLFLANNSAHCVQYSVFPPVAYVLTGEGLVLQFIPADDSLQSCTVRFSGNPSTIDLKPNVNYPQNISYWGRGLDAGDCGVIVPTFDPKLHSGSWIFQLKTMNGSERRSTAKINALDINESNSPITLIAEMGIEVQIPCGKADAIYCQLINPVGEIVRNGENCNMTIPRLRKADVGLWYCSEGISVSVQERVTEINITVHAVTVLEIGHNETLRDSTIFCNHLTKNITFCRFERSDGKAFILADGRNIDRYTYFGRGLSFNDCGLSLLKPLKKEDLGTWMCTLGLEDGGRSGGFIRIGDPGASQASHLQSTMQPQKIFIQSGSVLILDCFVKTPINYCWFKHPNGTRYNPHPDLVSEGWKYHGDSLSQGQCGIEIFEAKISDTGIWNCGMGVQNEYGTAKDLQNTISVTVAEMPFVQNQTITSAMTGDWAILGCHSLQGEALQYCSFLAPNGTGYNLRQGQTRGRFAYHGAGLEYGDCGILINPVQSVDYGTWQCGAMLAATKDGQELVRSLILQAPGFLTSSALGLAIGFTLAAVLVAGLLLFYRNRVRRNRRNAGEAMMMEPRPHNFSITSDGSDDIEIRADDQHE